MTLLGHIAQLWRYPVKSMQGETCGSLFIESHGIFGDRCFAFESDDAPVGKPLLGSRARAAMLQAQARTDALGVVTASIADRGSLSLHDADLIAWFGSDLPPEETHLLHREEHPFTDVRPIALHSLATERALAQALGSFDGRRLRSNIILSLEEEVPFAEDALAGRHLQLGSSAELLLLERIPRCRMVSLHPETASADPSILRWLSHHRQGRAGIYARPLLRGAITVGDVVYLQD